MRFDHFNLDSLVKLVGCKTIDKALELLRDPELENEIVFFVTNLSPDDPKAAHAVMEFTVFDILERIVDAVDYIVSQYTGKLTGVRFETVGRDGILRCDVEAGATAVYTKIGLSRVSADEQEHEFYKILYQALRESYTHES